MDEKFQKIRQVALAILKTTTRPTIATILIACILIMFLASAVYVITLDDGSHKEDDWSNTPYASEQYTSGVVIDENGNMSASMTAQELWDKMMENGSRVNEYLEGPEELLRLMNAQVVTDYLDTRPNPDEPIDWENLNKDVNSKDVQGIIKLKRANSDGTTSTLVYTDPATFQGYIDKYNSTGSESDKKEALKYFTLDNSNNSTIGNANTLGSLNNVLVIGDSIAGSLKSGLQAEGATVLNQGGENANFFLGEVGASMSNAGICQQGVKFDWNTHIASLDTPSAICIILGQNLCGGGSGWVSNGIQDIKELVVKLQQQFPNVQISINSVVPTIENCTTYPNYMLDYNNVVNLLSSYCSSTEGVTYIQTLDGYITEGGYAQNSMTGDGLHPNSSGASILVQNIKSKIVGSVADISSTSTNSSSDKYYAKVATWSEMTNIITTDDPSVEECNTTTYIMTSTKIDYQKFVSGYKMPFDYLWAFLVVGQDKDFVFDLANLVYESEIEITVHDNVTTTNTVNTDTYTKKTKVVTDNVNVSVTYDNSSGSSTSTTETGGPFEKELESTYTTVETVMTKRNTLDISLTKADVWIVKYTQDYTYEIEDSTTTTSNIEYDDEEYAELPDKTDNLDTAGLAEEYRQSTQTTYEQSYSNVSTSVTSLNSEYYYKTVDRTVDISNTVDSKKYIESPANMEEKTDKQSEEENFVTLFLKHDRIETNIKGAADWLFEILETGKNTVDLVDLTKYLLYKATNRNYGVTEFDFGIFDPATFVSIGGLYGSTMEEKVWFALRDAGYSEYAAAGAMGNFWAESGFQSNNLQNSYETSLGYSDEAYTEAVNDGSYTQQQFVYDEAGYGLAQWTYWSRKEGLYTFAKSRGVSIDNENMQIEYLLGELSFSGGADGHADCMLASRKGCTPDDWINATSPEDAAYAFCWIFENPAGYNVARETKAREYYEEFKGRTRPSFSGETVRAAGYEFPHYLQGDYPGPYGTSTIPRAGCGPTSLAMILAGLKGDPSITPQTVVDNINDYWPNGSYYVPGVGSSHCIFYSDFLQRYYGVTSEVSYPGEAEAMQALEMGYPLIGGETGHILAIIPAPDEYKAQGYKFYILDSGRGHDGPYRSVAEASQVVEGNLKFTAIIKP